MTLPSIQEIQVLTRKRVIEADKQDTLHNLTPKLLRREIETELGLDEGDLDAVEYRNAIKKTIESTMVEIGTEKNQDVNESVKKPGPPKKSKGKKRASDVGADEEPKKKVKVGHKREDGDRKQAKRKNKTAEKTDTSPSLHEQTTAGLDSSPRQDNLTPAKPHTKRNKKAPVRIDDSDEEPTEEPGVIPQPTRTESSGGDIVLPEDLSPSPPSKENTNDKTDYKSESELSVLIDESPKRKRKTKIEKDKSIDKPSNANAKKGTKSKTKKSENLSKDEETIKRLKSFVIACGVRRVWSKVFQGLETPVQQIEKLKEILRELGMTGRLSLEKAKAIREKREFAQELQDVQEFQKAVMKSGRKDEATVTTTNDVKHVSDSEDEEDEHPNTRRRKMNAAQSISAFLGDQSSDED